VNSPLELLENKLNQITQEYYRVFALQYSRTKEDYANKRKKFDENKNEDLRRIKRSMNEYQEIIHFIQEIKSIQL